jgi:hypothetical protein
MKTACIQNIIWRRQPPNENDGPRPFYKTPQYSFQIAILTDFAKQNQSKWRSEKFYSAAEGGGILFTQPQHRYLKKINIHEIYKNQNTLAMAAPDPGAAIHIPHL